MKFFEDSILQARKRRHLVCGDFYLCKRTPEATVIILCDGVGSGVYANVAAITCGNRLMELLECGRSLRSACEHVAESMHRARTEESPFAAFVAVRILPGGQFTAYAYENPGPILVHHEKAAICEQHYIAVQYEMIAEASGILELGDMLLVCSDGVTHAGMGSGYATGWELDGVAQEINAHFRMGAKPDTLLSRLLHTAYTISGKAYWDDTSLAMVTCRPAAQLSILTGPPTNRADDKSVIDRFVNMPGKKVIAGSSTTEIASRELNRPAIIADMNIAFDRPPEYVMDGIDLITEGAVTLNQVMNLIVEEDLDFSQSDSPVFKLCHMLMEADVIIFLVGCGYNPAHEDPLFRQLGVKPRQRIVKRIADYLAEQGKLVSIHKF